MNRSLRNRGLSLALGSALLVSVLAACADAEGGSEGPEDAEAVDDDYFDGETITWIVPAGPGSGNDTLSRMYGNYLVEYLPGEPQIVYEYMEGGGGVEAANHLANVAEDDGLTISVASQDAFMAQVTGSEGVQYNYEDFTFLGNFTDDDQMLIVLADTGITDFDDLLALDEPLVGGAHTASHPVARMPLLLDFIFEDVDMFRMTYGYAGGAELLLDMERGALQARSSSIGSLMSNQPDWIDDEFIVPVVYAHQERHADFPDVPTLGEVVPSESAHLLDLMFAPAAVSRALATTPDAPEGAVALLRDAFAAMAEDEAFLSELEDDLGFLFGFTTGDDIREAVANVVGDEEMIDNVLALIAE